MNYEINTRLWFSDICIYSQILGSDWEKDYGIHLWEGSKTVRMSITALDVGCVLAKALESH